MKSIRMCVLKSNTGSAVEIGIIGIGLMGHACRGRNVLLCLGALEEALADIAFERIERPEGLPLIDVELRAVITVPEGPPRPGPSGARPAGRARRRRPPRAPGADGPSPPGTVRARWTRAGCSASRGSGGP